MDPYLDTWNVCAYCISGPYVMNFKNGTIIKEYQYKELYNKINTVYQCSCDS